MDLLSMLRLTLTIIKGVAHECTSSMLCDFVIDDERSIWLNAYTVVQCLLVIIRLCTGNEKHLPCDLFPVMPEQVTIKSHVVGRSEAN